MVPQQTRVSRVIGGRYQLLAPLGSGGFGQVWRAHDEVLNAEVAVKEIWLPPTASDAERRERLARAEREARNAAKLRDHPHVVAVHDVVIEDDVPWIVMRLVIGSSLHERVQAHGPVPVDEATWIAAGLLSALSAAHAAGIVHRDVKPGNVMLADTGEVLLTDFGIAVHTADTSLTASHLIVGSAEYSAPERLRGDDGHAASDLFSLGATLYFAVEGVSPFRRADNIGATISAVLTVDPPPPRRAGQLAPLIAGLLRKNPAERPSIPQAQAMLAGPPRPSTLSMTHAPWIPPSRTPSRTRARTGIAVGVLLTVAVMVLAVALWGPRLAHDLANSGGTTGFDPASLDQASTDKTPQTVAALFPPSFTDANKIVYTLRSGGNQSCAAT